MQFAYPESALHQNSLEFVKFLDLDVIPFT